MQGVADCQGVITILENVGVLRSRVPIAGILPGAVVDSPHQRSLDERRRLRDSRNESTRQCGVSTRHLLTCSPPPRTAQLRAISARKTCNDPLAHSAIAAIICVPAIPSSCTARAVMPHAGT